MVDFAALDWVVIALFFAGVVGLGFSAKLRENTSLQMVAAGRALTMPLFVATLITTWYGGVLGTPEFYNDFGYGLATLTVNGIPYWIAGLLFAFFLAKRIRGEPQISIPERIERCYGRIAGLIAALLVTVLATPAAFVLMLGTLLVTVFAGLDLWAGIAIGGIGCTAFLYRGGLMADARSNTISFVMMYSAFIMILLIAIGKYGAPWAVIPQLPDAERTWDAGKGIFVVISWMFVGAWTFVDPGFHQRVAAVKDEASARRGVLLAVVFWIIFDTLTTLTAMYGTIALRGSDPSAMGRMLFPLFGNQLLPAGMKGVFFAGMFGAIIAATVGYTFVSGTTLSRDFFARLKGELSEAAITNYTRICIAIAALLGIVLAITVNSVVDLWYKVASLVIPGLLVPVVGAYAFKKPPSAGTAVACLIVPPAIATAWMLLASQAVHWENSIFGTASESEPAILTPMIVGIIVALLIWGIGSLAERKKRI
ncbi:MAG: sodium:solute symporter family protein [Armatimonadota bacterium]|nr:sodium:solute symporter family protein [Armatimonadota bacterium]